MTSVTNAGSPSRKRTGIGGRCAGGGSGSAAGAATGEVVSTAMLTSNGVTGRGSRTRSIGYYLSCGGFCLAEACVGDPLAPPPLILTGRVGASLDGGRITGGRPGEVGGVLVQPLAQWLDVPLLLVDLRPQLGHLGLQRQNESAVF